MDPPVAGLMESRTSRPLDHPPHRVVKLMGEAVEPADHGTAIVDHAPTCLRQGTPDPLPLAVGTGRRFGRGCSPPSDPGAGLFGQGRNPSVQKQKLHQRMMEKTAPAAVVVASTAVKFIGAGHRGILPGHLLEEIPETPKGVCAGVAVAFQKLAGVGEIGHRLHHGGTERRSAHKDPARIGR